MVDQCPEPNRVGRKRSRRNAGERLPALGLKPLDPSMRLLKPRPRKAIKEWMPALETDLAPDLPITIAELDAILHLLGDELKSIL
jgi:hypothetical protein